MTPQEVKLWNWLREAIVPIGFHPRRQVAIGPFVVDFAFLKQRLVLEIDGEQHGTSAGRERDAARDRNLALRGYRVLRFMNADVDRRKTEVLETIHAALLAGCRPTPVGCADSPSPTGEGSGP